MIPHDMEQHDVSAQFVVCLKNDGYAASLEVCKIDRVLPDAGAAKHALLRVIDESGVRRTEGREA
jgi:hypothetical protein